MSAAHVHFRQMRAMLGWRSNLRVAMLWAFLDESGQHDASGKLVRLSIGGCIAPFEKWEAMSMGWAEAVARMGLEMFHMTDFEARVRPYDTWSKAQREDRLNVLLELIGDGQPTCWGFTKIVTEKGETDEKMYEECAKDALLSLGVLEDDLAIVFAYHPQYRRHNDFLSVLVKHGYGHNIRSCGIAQPEHLCPLQAADIVAYEIRCEERLERPRRYPLRRLTEMGCTFRFGMNLGFYEPGVSS